MARIRTIKPEFNSSESVARMSESAQLFMLKLLPEMDDHGRIAWYPKKIAGNLYPHREDIGSAEIEQLASELEREGILLIYEIDGKRYACFPKWTDHQKVDRPGKTLNPPPEKIDNIEPVAQSSRKSRETPDKNSRLDMGNGKRDMGYGNREMGEGLGEGAEILEDNSETVRLEIDDGGIIDAEIVDDDSPPSIDEQFDSFMASYPRGSNSNPVTAKRAWNTLAFAEVNLGEVISGAERYAKCLKAQGKIGSQFVMQEATFLRLIDRKWEQEWKPPERGSSGGEISEILEKAQATVDRFGYPEQVKA